MTSKKIISYKIEVTLNGYSNRKEFFNENNFEKYINSLPKYYKRSRSKYENYIKDYLLKNRSARLSDIVNGCQEQELKLKGYNLGSIFYKSLKNLIESGHVTKKDKIYFWNYK